MIKINFICPICGRTNEDYVQEYNINGEIVSCDGCGKEFEITLSEL